MVSSNTVPLSRSPSPVPMMSAMPASPRGRPCGHDGSHAGRKGSESITPRGAGAWGAGPRGRAALAYGGLRYVRVCFGFAAPPAQLFRDRHPVELQPVVDQPVAQPLGDLLLQLL